MNRPQQRRKLWLPLLTQASHAAEMAATGAEFVVLPHAFAVHLPHAPSIDIVRFRKSRNYRE